MRYSIMFSTLSAVFASTTVTETLIASSNITAVDARPSQKIFVSGKLNTTLASTVVSTPAPTKGTPMWKKVVKTAAVVGGVGLVGSLMKDGVDSPVLTKMHEVMTRPHS